MGDHKVKRIRSRDDNSHSKHSKQQGTIVSGASTPTDEDVTVPKSVLKLKDDRIPAANDKVCSSSRITQELLCISVRLAEYTFQDLQYTPITVQSYISPYDRIHRIVICWPPGASGHTLIRTGQTKVSIDSSNSLQQIGKDCKAFQLVHIEIH
jgi:hypothetical protein